MINVPSPIIDSAAVSILRIISDGFHNLSENDSLFRQVCIYKTLSRPLFITADASGIRVAQHSTMDISGLDDQSAVWALDVGWQRDRWSVRPIARITHSDVNIDLGERFAATLAELKAVLDQSIEMLVATMHPEGALFVEIKRLQETAHSDKKEGWAGTVHKVLRGLRMPAAIRTCRGLRRTAPCPVAENGAQDQQKASDIDTLANAAAVSAIESIGAGWKKLKDFSQALTASAPNGVHTYLFFEHRRFEPLVTMYVEKEINLHEGHVACWALELDWSEGNWCVSTDASIAYSDIRIRLDDKLAASTVDLGQTIDEAVEALIATAQPGAEFAAAIDSLRAQACEAATESSDSQVRR